MDGRNALGVALICVGLAMAIGSQLSRPEVAVMQAPVDIEMPSSTPVEPKPLGGRAVPAKPSIPDGGWIEQDGLRVAVLEAGTGGTVADGNQVTVEYVGWLKGSDAPFDTSYSRPGPLKYTVGKVNIIEGWSRSVSQMRVGEKRLVQIPASLAYGERGRAPTIPPNADLEFLLELKAVAPGRQAPKALLIKPQEEYTLTDSGLRYRDVRTGEGAMVPESGMVEMEYTVWTPQGELVESSYISREEPLLVPIGKGQVIKAWDEGVPGMRVGGMRQIVAGPHLAYGTTGRPPKVGPGATVVFDIEVVGVR